MKIGIDARTASEVPAGRGRLVRELLRALLRLDPPHDFRLYARRAWEEVPLSPRFEWRLSGGSPPVWALRTARTAGGECDVLFATSSYLLGAATNAPVVLLVHDFVAFDRALGPPTGALLERITLPLAAKRARAFICISEATQRELVKRVPSAASRTRVIPLAAGAPFFDAHPDGVARRYGITRPYVLATGTLEPRKNLRRLIEAFAGLDPALRESHELVLAGAEGWQTRETLEAIGRNAGLVRALGHVPEADLPSLYAGATIFAYPSLREGFGLPVLEAMAAGVPVLTSDVSSLPEVGGEAVVYADPYSVESIRAGLRQLLEETALRERLAKEGRERAATFRWSDAAKITLEVLEQAAA